VQYSNEHGEARSELAGKIVDSFTNNFAVNLFSRFTFEKLRIAFSQKIEQEKNYQAQYYITLMLCSLSILFLVGIITLNGLLIFYWIENKISTGEVIQVFNTTFNVAMILWISGELLPQFFKSFGIATQALSVMNDPQDVIDLPHSQALLIKKGEIIFENVSFQYGEKKLFHNKHVRIQGGEKVGLVGYSGAGKSTFVNLILRFYPITKGRILIDGQDISQVTLDSLRHQVALIPQDPLLFHRTLEENIQYGNIQASQEEIIQAAKWAHCDEFIRKCPNGYATLVGERGTKLSGGERQRIAISRAMLAGCPILILDEATSSLDSITEKFIQDSLENLMQNRTTLVIAHRLSTLAKMDRILVFDQGKIVEEGTHNELMNQGGHYARLWEMQSGGFLPEAP
jgi:ATP-binding cassette, subfamily B, bacterial